MRYAALMLATMTLAAAPAHADYFFHLTQFDDDGTEIERAACRCGDYELMQDRCTEGVMLVIEGKPRPVELRFKNDGNILRITMATGPFLLETTSRKRRLS